MKDLGWLEDKWEMMRKKKGVTVDQMPKQLKGKVNLIPFLSFYYNSFWELSTERTQDGYIPWSSIRKYCEVWGLTDPSEFDSFLRIIRSMDRVYMNQLQKERKKEMDKANK